MSDTEKNQSPKRASASTDAAKASKEDLQAAFDEANEQGYFGTVPDPTPNENYTVKGVTSGAPTPETDADLRKQVREQRAP
jgi:hypothetical protein